MARRQEDCRNDHASDEGEQFRELLDQAKAPDPQVAKPKARRGRSVILTGTDEFRVNDQAVAALANDPDIYSRGGLLVRIVNEDQDTERKVTYPAGPRIVPVSAATLRERLTKVADWYAPKGEGKYVPTHPPESDRGRHDQQTGWNQWGWWA